MLGPASVKTTTQQGNVILNAKIIRGVAHPPGEPDTYNGLKLTRKEIFEKYESLPGTMVYDNHDLSRPIGKVLAVTIGDEGELLMDAIISKDYPYSEEVIQRVLSGDYKGMSLGMDHKVNMETGYVHESNINELSLCPEGDLPGTLIRTVANNQRGMDNPFQTKWFDLDTGASDISAFEMNKTLEAANKAFDWINGFNNTNTSTTRTSASGYHRWDSDSSASLTGQYKTTDKPGEQLDANGENGGRNFVGANEYARMASQGNVGG